MVAKHRARKPMTTKEKDHSVDEWKEVSIQRFEPYLEAPKFASEEYLSLKGELHNRLFDCLNETMFKQLTENQRMVIEQIFYQGMTYKQSAAFFDRNYTTTSHSLYGIWSDKFNKYHGGSLNKIKKVLSKDPIFVNLLKTLRNLSEDQSSDLLEKYTIEELERMDTPSFCKLFSI